MTLDISHDQTRWKAITKGSSRMFRLQQRQRILFSIRGDFYEQDFLEAETPLLVKGTCPDAHIDSIQAGDGYLVTSTEYQIKRLIVGGFERVFTLTKNFRANDQGRYHSPEFTMLEWGRAFESLQTIEEDCIRFVRKAFRTLYPDPNQSLLHFNGKEIDLMANWERLSVRDAFNIHLGLEHLEDFSLEPLCLASERAGLAIPLEFQSDKHVMISYLLDLLQPYLGQRTPTFLQEWPAYLTSSAPISSKDPSIAERSELYINGIEIADGFPFLRDTALQKHLFAQELKRRKELGKPAVILDERYLNTLSGLPSGAGMALGIDRLVMVLTGASQLADVQAFGWDEL